MKYYDVTLASASPRRAELVKKIPWLRVAVFPSSVLEPKFEGGDAAKYACSLAEAKARDVFAKCGGVVIGADTVVAVGNKVLGKPRDDADAENMFKLLCGNTHEVISGICVVNSRKTVAEFEKTYVTFGAFDEKIVYNYIKSGASADKAGGYGLQDGELASLIKRVEGDRDNVIGLPVSTLEKTLKEFF